MRALLGGKGANLAEMAAIGLPVPPGFTITTALCNSYYDAGRTLPAGLDAEIEAGLAYIEGIAGAGFGDPDHTLLVSVRSGARASMPGMMDTVLNLGLNDETADGLARVSGDARFAYDSYRRLIQMYGDVVLGVEHRAFEELLEQEKEARGYRLDTEMEAGDWFRLIEAYKALVRDETGSDFPQDARVQLRGAIRAVLDSWMNARAVTYRRLHGIPGRLGHGGHGAGHGVRQHGRATAPPASPSRGTRRPVKPRSMASISSTRKERTWWPASVRPAR